MRKKYPMPLINPEFMIEISVRYPESTIWMQLTGAEVGTQLTKKLISSLQSEIDIEIEEYHIFNNMTKEEKDTYFGKLSEENPGLTGEDKSASLAGRAFRDRL